MKKNLPKTATAKLYTTKQWKAMHKQLTSLRLYLLYCYFIIQSLMFTKTGQLHLTYVSPIIQALA